MRCDGAGARDSSSLRGEWSRRSRGCPRPSRPRAACARVCGLGTGETKGIDDTVRLAPVAAQHDAGRWPALADMPDRPRRSTAWSRAQRRCSRPSSCCPGRSHRNRRTLDTSASNSWAELATGSIPSLRLRVECPADRDDGENRAPRADHPHRYGLSRGCPSNAKAPKRRKISGKICERATSTNRARTGDLSPVILDQDRVSAGSLGAFRGRLSNRQYCYDRRLSISALSAASIVRYEASAAITRDRVSAMQPVSPTPSISAHRSASS
jgi:hypothetical protein